MGITLAVNLKHMIPYSQIAEWDMKESPVGVMFYTDPSCREEAEKLSSIYDVEIKYVCLYGWERIEVTLNKKNESNLPKP